MGGKPRPQWPPLGHRAHERLRDRLGGLDEHDVGGALHGLEFSVEGDAAEGCSGNSHEIQF
jgi:hypothetical protein